MKELYFFGFTLSLFFSFAVSLDGQTNLPQFEECQTKYSSMPPDDILDYVTASKNSNRNNNTDTIIIPIVIHNLMWNHKGYIADHEFVGIVNSVNDRLANRGDFYDPFGVDTKIRICLATENPVGNATNGILHKEHPLVLDNDYPFDRDLLWDVSRYLNVFIYDGNIGFASFPWDLTGFQGIYIGYERLRHPLGVITFVHEIGHALGLYHTFEGGCAIYPCIENGDMVCDTPPDKISFSPCFNMDSCKYDVDPNDPFGLVEGDSNDMIENYMDGAICASRFTQGQVDRMNWALNMYKPDWDSNGSICSDCPSIQVEFESNKRYAIAGENISFNSLIKDVGGKYSYTWFVDGELMSNDEIFDISFESPGVKIVRLSVFDDSGDCKNIKWSVEKSFSIRCPEDEKLNIVMPNRMVLDSCYTVQISGISNLEWSFETFSGTENEFIICPEIVGLNSIKISYGNDFCSRFDEVHYMVYPNLVRSRSFFRQKMRFNRDSSSSQDVMKIYEVGDEIYRLIGTENLKRFNGRMDTVYNFIRTWYPNEQTGIEWQLYNADLSSSEFSYPVNSRLQLDFLDIIEDENNNSKYFLAHEYYATDFNSSFILGKLNTLGRVIWAKRLEMPDLNIYPGRTLGNKYIHLVDNDLILNFEHVLSKFDKDGNVLKSVSMQYLPKELYGRGLTTRFRGFEIKDDKIFMSHITNVVDTSKYPIHTDSMSLTNVDALNNLIFDTNFNLESSSFKTVPSSVLGIEPNTFFRRAYKQGSLLFWSQRQCLQTDCEIQNNYHFIHVDKFNNVLNYQVLYDYEGSSDSDITASVKVLANNDVILVKSVSGGAGILYIRLGNQLEVTDKRLIELEDFSSYLEGDVNNGRSEIRKGSDASTLTQDGILTSFHINGRVFSPRFFYLIPLDSNLMNCSYTVPEIEMFNGEILSFSLNPILDVFPIRIYTEDIELQTQKSEFNSEVICESTYELEDYYISNINTGCKSIDNIEISFDVCRTKPDSIISLPYHLFLESPLENEVPFIENGEVLFSSGQICVTIDDIILPDNNYHIVLNSRLEYPTPYTLKKSFFDASEELEFDYLNNYSIIKSCDSLVSNLELKTKDEVIKVYPNPTNETLNLSVDNHQINELRIYNNLGILVYSNNELRPRHQISISNWINGLYFINVKLEKGVFVNAKFTKF